jgi:uncharacterized membrane protein
MATIVGDIRPRAKSLAPDTFERVLAAGSIVLLAAVAVALFRGWAEWGRIPTVVWLHLSTIIIALALTPPLLLRRRGDRRHRLLGRIWVVAMLATALISFGLYSNGRWSAIHLLSLGTLAVTPVIWWSAKTHRVETHRSAVRGMVTGALLIAGFFTFPFNRLLGHWLLG